MTRHEQEKLGRLQRRADHLAKRIAASDKDLSYDKAELSALQWAITFITGALETEHEAA